MSGPDFDLLARYYDLEYADFDADLGLYLGFASRTGGPLLEYGCGTGRLLLPLAEAGYSLTGLDVSAGMLARASKRLAARPDLAGRVTLLQGDACTLGAAPSDRFALAFWAINSFMHLENLEDQTSALGCAREALRDGGLLILDLFQPDPQVLVEADGRLLHDATWPQPETGGRVVKLSSRRVDLARQLLEVTYFYDEYSPDGRTTRVVAPFSMRYLHRFEAQLLLERAGFFVEAIYGDYELEEFGADSQRMIFVARKGS